MDKLCPIPTIHITTQLKIGCFLVMFFISPSAFADSWRDQSESTKKSQSEIKKKASQIEIIEGTPTKPFTKIQPIWSTSMVSMERAIDGAKKQAAKVGADAIIEIKIGTSDSTVVSGAFAGSSPQPVITGWAIKWTEESSESAPAKGQK